MFTSLVLLSFLNAQFNHSVVSDSLWPHELQHTKLPCPSPTPWACSNSCPSSRWCHSTILSSVVPFSSCLQSFPASGSFSTSQFFPSGGQHIGASASASVLPMNIQDRFPLGLTGLISLQSKGKPGVLEKGESWRKGSPGEGKGYPLQYSGLENSMECTVHGVAKSWTRLNDFHF